MKHLVKIFIILCAASLLFPEIQVSISSSATLATIGDRINLKIIAKTNVDIQDMKVSTKQKDFEIIEEKELQKRKEKDYVVFEKNIIIAFFKTGEFDIEPFHINFINDNKIVESRETNSIPVSVKTVLREEDKDIKPLKELIELKGNPFYIMKYVIIALVAALIVILIVLWLRRRAKRPQIAEQPLLPPLQELEEAVKKLWQQQLFEKGKIKTFFIHLTKIIKRFLYRKYDFNAEDSTTFETMYYLKNKEQDALVLNNMSYILDIADLVKFAKYIPEPNIPLDILARINDTAAVYKKREAPQVPQEDDVTLRK